MRSHPLDCPIWSALSSQQASFGSDGALARRFREDVSPFAAAVDDSDAAVAALAAVAHADDDMSLLEREPPARPLGIRAKNARGVQMVLDKLGADAAYVAFEALGDADAPEMVALATLTRPGPFRASTHKLGRFIGISR
jgi:hypothetical protein